MVSKAQTYAKLQFNFLALKHKYDSHFARKYNPNWKNQVINAEQNALLARRELTAGDLPELEQLLPPTEYRSVFILLDPNPKLDAPW